jgi:MFS family permease
MMRNRLLAMLECWRHVLALRRCLAVRHAISYRSADFVGLPWGRLSDSWGRKPIVLCGLLGTVAATLVFGFSKSYIQALLARTSAGLLNGNVGVIRTMVAEMVVERAHQAKAFSVMPVVWSAGSILGPVLGGAYDSLLKNLTN